MITLALAYLRDRPLTTALNVLLLAIIGGDAGASAATGHAGQRAL